MQLPVILVLSMQTRRVPYTFLEFVYTLRLRMFYQLRKALEKKCASPHYFALKMNIFETNKMEGFPPF